jgi:hypothetical protein
MVTAMCEMAGPRFKDSLLLALTNEEEETDIGFNKMAASPLQQYSPPPASSSEEGYASATISPSGENTNHDEDREYS